MEDVYIIDKAVRDCIDDLESKNAEPTLIIANEAGDWFTETKERAIDVSQKFVDQYDLQWNFVANCEQRVIVVGEFEDGSTWSVSRHFDTYRRSE